MSNEKVNPNDKKVPVVNPPLLPSPLELKFRIYAEDQQRLNEHIELAFLLKLIPKQDLQQYMAFCLNCGAAYLEHVLKGK